MSNGMVADAIVRAGKNLGSPKWADILEPEGERPLGQQMMAESVQQLSQPNKPEEYDYTWDEWKTALRSPNLSNIVADYALGGRRIPEKAMEMLENQADYLDMDVNVMLELMSDSVLNGQY